MKNNIKNKKDLLSAYLQLTDRSIKFLNQYSKDKILSASKLSANILNVDSNKNFVFPIKPKIVKVLLFNSIFNDSVKYLNFIESISYKELTKLVSSYKENNEFKRFFNIDMEEYISNSKNNIKLQLFSNLF